MAVIPGTRLGVYEVTAKLGEGGMGAVYRARDTKLDRDVAIKILPEAFAHDADRLARFTREAKTLASLNHPNIAAIYGLEESGGITALVMELVEGEDLSEVIARHGRGSGAPRGQAEAERGRPEAASVSERLREGDSAAERRGWGPAATKESGRPGAGTRQSGAPRGLSKAGLPLSDALAIARQIAEALEAAHEQGIIHRDLKPANVKVRNDGTVKVLDFGLAKAVSPAGTMSASASMSPTITTPAMTEMGMILGTAAYMAPEQAKGRAVDKRADIWAFGVVLYEMLTGQRAFAGEDVSDTLAAVLRADVNFDALPVDTPPRVRQVLATCLQRDPKRRLSDMQDVRLALDGAFETTSRAAVESVAAPRLSMWQRPASIALIGAGAAVVAGLAVWGMTRPDVVPAHLVRFTIVPPEVAPLHVGGNQPDLVISPDGAQVVYQSGTGPENFQLNLRPIDQLVGAPIRGTEGAAGPFVSPDGEWVGFTDSGTDQILQRVSIFGGPPVTVARAPAAIRGASWGGDDRIIFGTSTGLFRVSGGGGEPEALTTLDTEQEENAHLWPSIIPGRDAVVFVISAGEARDTGQLAVLDLTSGNVTRLGLSGVSPRYVATGHLVYAVEDSSVRAVPFDVASLTVAGSPVPLVESVSVKPSGAANFSVSSTGALVYVPGVASSSGAERTLAILGRQGGLERLRLPAKSYVYSRISPDGTRVAVSTEEAPSAADVWIYDLAGATAPRQLTLGGANRYPVWSADGERVAFQSNREGDLGIFWQKADGSGTAERLTTPETGIAHIPDSWSPDGKTLSYTALRTTSRTSAQFDIFSGAGAEGAVWLLSVQDKKATVFAEHADSLVGRSAFSPDGQWLAYQSTETGTIQIVVQPVPSTGAKYLVVRGGHPVWSPDGREILFNAGPGQNGAVRITPRPTFSFGEPTTRPLSGLRNTNPLTSPRPWDITHDGQGILGVADVADAAAADATPAPQIQVVLNWFEELKRRVPTE